jgi:hypothetical protein
MHGKHGNLLFFPVVGGNLTAAAVENWVSPRSTRKYTLRNAKSTGFGTILKKIALFLPDFPELNVNAGRDRSSNTNSVQSKVKNHSENGR